MPDQTISPKWLGLRAELMSVLSALTRKSTRADWLIRAITLILPLLFLALVMMQPWYDRRLMFLDTITAAEFADMCCRPYYGFVSTSGIFLWIASAAICLFSAFLLYAKRISDWRFGFALMAGLFTGWLAFDDAFLVHERVMPSFGVPQNAVLLSYLIAAAVYFYLNRRLMLRLDFWLLVMGVGCFAASLAVDIVFHSVSPVFIFLEDGSKFFAIFCWFSFHVTGCARLLDVTPASHPPR